MDKDGHTYGVNVKAALGCIDAGIGETHVNSFLSTLDIPPMHSAIYKRHERMAGESIESVAEESCREAIRVERDLIVSLMDKCVDL